MNLYIMLIQIIEGVSVIRGSIWWDLTLKMRLIVLFQLGLGPCEVYMCKYNNV